MEKIAPLMIVMTPVRNEAWVLKLFLTVTSIWADHIIIADQMSTDGSRDIAMSFPKVTLIDNDNPEFNEADRQKMLIEKAREIASGRDCILWGLDADEIFDAHYRHTKDWQRILNSKPGDVFWFKWAEICPDREHYWISPKTYFPWMFHDDGKEPHANYVRDMHSMRIPYPIDEKQMYYVDDFRVLHLAYLSSYRVASKRRFYTLVDWCLHRTSPIKLSRAYAQTKKNCLVESLPDYYVYSRSNVGYDMWDMIDLKTEKCWMDGYVLDHINKYPMSQIRKLDIWDNAGTEISKFDSRTFFDKSIHSYLHLTQRKTSSLLVRGIDKILVKFYH